MVVYVQSVVRLLVLLWMNSVSHKLRSLSSLVGVSVGAHLLPVFAEHWWAKSPCFFFHASSRDMYLQHFLLKFHFEMSGEVRRRL